RQEFYRNQLTAGEPGAVCRRRHNYRHAHNSIRDRASEKSIAILSSFGPGPGFEFRSNAGKAIHDEHVARPEVDQLRIGSLDPGVACQVERYLFTRHDV